MTPDPTREATTKCTDTTGRDVILGPDGKEWTPSQPNSASRVPTEATEEALYLAREIQFTPGQASGHAISPETAAKLIQEHVAHCIQQAREEIVPAGFMVVSENYMEVSEKGKEEAWALVHKTEAALAQQTERAERVEKEFMAAKRDAQNLWDAYANWQRAEQALAQGQTLVNELENRLSNAEAAVTEKEKQLAQTQARLEGALAQLANEKIVHDTAHKSNFMLNNAVEKAHETLDGCSLLTQRSISHGGISQRIEKLLSVLASTEATAQSLAKRVETLEAELANERQWHELTKTSLESFHKDVCNMGADLRRYQQRITSLEAALKAERELGDRLREAMFGLFESTPAPPQTDKRNYPKYDKACRKMAAASAAYSESRGADKPNADGVKPI